jgi:hypothetical protein
MHSGYREAEGPSTKTRWEAEPGRTPQAG